jgi:hypothetical protein
MVLHQIICFVIVHNYIVKANVFVDETIEKPVELNHPLQPLIKVILKK